MQFKALYIIDGDAEVEPVICTADDVDLAQVFHSGCSTVKTTPQEATAYVRLFRAAPDLLAAARKALNYIENTEGELDITLDSGDDLRAAIRRATEG